MNTTANTIAKLNVELKTARSHLRQLDLNKYSYQNHVLRLKVRAEIRKIKAELEKVEST